MPVTGRYFDALHALLRTVEDTEADRVDEAGRRIADSVGAGGMLHLFGSGHSMLAAIEQTVRAGGLAAANLLYDPALSPADPDRASVVERLHGYAAAVLDLAPIRAGEVLVVVSHSGINPVPVEMAVEGRGRGLTVVAVTSVEHSRRVGSRHGSGQRLADVADIVVDTHAPYGDAAVEVGGRATGAVSTILACAVLHAITVSAVGHLTGAGAEVPLLVSQNVDGGDDHNQRLFELYQRR